MAFQGEVARPPTVGTWVHVLPRNDDDSLIGSLIDDREGVVILTMREPYFLATGASVLLFCGEAGHRVALDASVVDPYSPRGAVFVKSSEWWPVDTRSNERYPVRLRSDLRLPGSDDELFGVTLNVSHGGLAIEVFEVPEETSIEVAVGLRTDPVYLPCEVVAAIPGRDTTMLRLRFTELDKHQRAHVARLVEDVKQHAGVAPPTK